MECRLTGRPGDCREEHPPAAAPRAATSPVDLAGDCSSRRTTVAPHLLLLSTQEAADLLRVSRTTLVRLLEIGAIPFEKPGRHRKVRLDDLLECRRRRRSATELPLADMIAGIERLGLYDADPEDIRGSPQGHAEEARKMIFRWRGRLR